MLRLVPAIHDFQHDQRYLGAAPADQAGQAIGCLCRGSRHYQRLPADQFGHRSIGYQQCAITQAEQQSVQLFPVLLNYRKVRHVPLLVHGLYRCADVVDDWPVSVPVHVVPRCSC